MKRIVALTLGFLMIFSLTACSNKGDGTKKDVSAPEVQDYNIAVCIPITGTNATYAAYIKNGLEMLWPILKSVAASTAPAAK